jgi:cytochrome c551
MTRSEETATKKQQPVVGFKRVFLLSVVSTLCFIFLNCTQQTNQENNNSSSNKFQQYYYQGEQLYTRHCGNCHQKGGKGLGRVYPPLDSSDYMQQNFESVICLIRNGKKGELIVNGKSFNQPMPGISILTDLEIAEISTYIYNTWKNKRGIIDVKEVSKILTACPPAE